MSSKAKKLNALAALKAKREGLPTVGLSLLAPHRLAVPCASIKNTLLTY